MSSWTYEEGDIRRDGKPALSVDLMVDSRMKPALKPYQRDSIARQVATLLDSGAIIVPQTVDQANRIEAAAGPAFSSSSDCAVAAIEFALSSDEGMTFLRHWFHGDFDILREEWPEAPASVYAGADPLDPNTALVNKVSDETLTNWARALVGRGALDLGSILRGKEVISEVLHTGSSLDGVPNLPTLPPLKA